MKSNLDMYSEEDRWSLPQPQEERKALDGVAQWIEHRPANERVAGLTPSQGTCLGCELGQVFNREHERQPHIDVFLPLSLPPFLPV